MITNQPHSQDQGVKAKKLEPEDQFIKSGPDSLDNIEQGILDSAANIDQNAQHSAAERAHGHEDIVSFDHSGKRNISPQDIQQIKKEVDEDAEKQTGKPTGAIYGDGEDEMSVEDSFQK